MMEKAFSLVIIFSIILVVFGQPQCINPGSQCLVDTSTEAVCSDSGILPPSGDNRWMSAGLDVYTDIYIKCGKIIAFKLEWFPVGSGRWSRWFVVGVNDIDIKADAPNARLKRWWSYFADHRHQYIICKQNRFIGCNCTKNDPPCVCSADSKEPCDCKEN